MQKGQLKGPWTARVWVVVPAVPDQSKAKPFCRTELSKKMSNPAKIVISQQECVASGW